MKKDRQRKYFSVIVLTVISSFFLLISFNPASIVEFPVRHFTPIFALFIILISEIINKVLSGNLLFTSDKILVIVSLLIGFTGQGIGFITKPLFIFQNPLNLFNIQYIENPAVLAVKKEIISIQRIEHKEHLDFFSFIYYRNGWEDRFNLTLGLIPRCLQRRKRCHPDRSDSEVEGSFSSGLLL